MKKYAIIRKGKANPGNTGTGFHRIGIKGSFIGDIDVWFGETFNIKSATAALKIARKIVKTLNTPE